MIYFISKYLPVTLNHGHIFLTTRHKKHLYYQFNQSFSACRKYPFIEYISLQLSSYHFLLKSHVPKQDNLTSLKHRQCHQTPGTWCCSCPSKLSSACCLSVGPLTTSELPDHPSDSHLHKKEHIKI